ncbi:MAG: hypothetical protein KY462_16200 [Actinobacteria bacterium]|nr:hypothetical protein [Actinomycetota bacterium]
MTDEQPPDREEPQAREDRESVSLDPETVRRLRAMTRMVAEDMQRHVAQIVIPFRERAAEIREQAEAALAGVRSTLERAGRAAVDAIERTVPPNWDLADPRGLVELFRGRFDLAVEGVVVTWVPRNSVLNAIENTDDGDDRRAVLVANADAILEDCRQALQLVADSDGRPVTVMLAGYGLEAVDAAGDGRWAAAQALAVNVLETSIRRLLGKKLPQLRDESIEWDDAATLYWLRESMTMVAVQPALEGWWPDRQPVPARLDRHATVHAVDPVQYTQANALQAVMLVASLLREAHQMWLRRSRPVIGRCRT